ncbi:MBL fold metallo-hydrolase [bacterium]|nr:MBL fold metallo-hydrolase [bacterium]
MIIKELSVAPIGTNCYILACENKLEAIIIDPGGEADRILGVIDQEKFDLKYIINTHAHFDHVGAVPEIQKARKVPFLLHKDDEPFIEPEAFRQSLAMFGMSGMTPPKVDQFIDTTKEYSFGDVTFKILETPGHSPGGVCFLFEKEVFVGDTLFAGSVGRTDLPGGSMKIMMDSIKKKLMTLDSSISVYCGHMGSTTIGHERKFNPFRQYWEG